MTFLIGGFRLTNFGDFRLTVFGQFNPTLTQEKKDALKKRKETLQGNYEYYRDYEKDLRTVTANIDEILGVDTNRQNSKQHEEELS